MGKCLGSRRWRGRKRSVLVAPHKLESIPPNQDGFNPIFCHKKNWGVWVPQVGSKNLFEAREVGWNAPIISLSVFFLDSSAKTWCDHNPSGCFVWDSVKTWRNKWDARCPYPRMREIMAHESLVVGIGSRPPGMKTRLGARGELKFKKLQV